MATRISDVRTPFRDMNGRQSEKRRSRSTLQKENITVSLPDLSGADLDALIYQKAMGLVALEKQNFDRSLQLKSACIQELQEMMLATTNEKNARITELQELLLSSTASAQEIQQQQQVDYKRGYERVSGQLRQLEEQLLTYTRLQDGLKTTRELQRQVQQRLREAHSKVLRDASILTEKAQVLDSQAQGILERQKLDQLMEKMMSENFRLRQVVRETELKLAASCSGASEVSQSELEKQNEEEIVSLKNRLADVEQQLITANDATEERNARIEILLANRRESEETVALQREKIAKLEEELATIQLTVGNVQQEMAALSAERDALSVTLVNQQAAAQRQIDDLMEQLCTAQSNQEFAELELRATKEDLDNKEQQLVRSQQAQEDVENILTDYRSRYTTLERCLEHERQELKIITGDFNNTSIGVGQLVEKVKVWQLELEDMRTRAEESDDSDNTPLATSLNLSGITELPVSDMACIAVKPLSISPEASNVDSDNDDENVADAGDVTRDGDANSRTSKSIVARVLLGMKAVSQKQKKVADDAKTNAATREMKEEKVAVTSIAWQQLNQILKDADSRLDAVRRSEASLLNAFNVQRKKFETHIGQLEDEVKALTTSAAESVECEKRLLDELARRDEHQHHLQDTIAALRKSVADSVHALALKERDCESLQKMRVEKHELERRLETNASDLAAMTRRVQVLEGEMRVMEEEMAALLAGESLDARIQRQAIDDRTKLRKKNYQLEYDLLVCQQTLDDVKLKASERLDVLDLNWKRAEKEVQRLDEQLMDISKVLLPYKDTVLAVCPQLVPLLSWPADDVCLASSKHVYAPATGDHFAVPAPVSSLAANSIPSLQTPSKMGAPSTMLGYGLTPIRSLRVTPLKGGTTPSRWAASAAAPFSDLQDIDWIISKLDEMVESEKND